MDPSRRSMPIMTPFWAVWPSMRSLQKRNWSEPRRSLDAVAASTLSVAGLTAWFAVVELGAVRAGQTLVVQGTGGVSLFALQFAVAHGAQVIVTSSSDSKLQRAMALGAREGINRVEHPEWHHRVLEITGGRGAEHILEMAGGDHVARSLEAVSLGGRVSIIGLLEDATSMPLSCRCCLSEPLWRRSR